MEYERYSRHRLGEIAIGTAALLGLAWILATAGIETSGSEGPQESIGSNCYYWEGEARSEWDNTIIRQSGVICSDRPRCPAPFDQHCISVTERPTER